MIHAVETHISCITEELFTSVCLCMIPTFWVLSLLQLVRHIIVTPESFFFQFISFYFHFVLFKFICVLFSCHCFMCFFLLLVFYLYFLQLQTFKASLYFTATPLFVHDLLAVNIILLVIDMTSSCYLATTYQYNTIRKICIILN